MAATATPSSSTSATASQLVYGHASALTGQGRPARRRRPAARADRQHRLLVRPARALRGPQSTARPIDPSTYLLRPRRRHPRKHDSLTPRHDGSSTGVRRRSSRPSRRAVDSLQRGRHIFSIGACRSTIHIVWSPKSICAWARTPGALDGDDPAEAPPLVVDPVARRPASARPAWPARSPCARLAGRDAESRSAISAAFGVPPVNRLVARRCHRPDRHAAAGAATTTCTRPRCAPSAPAAPAARRGTATPD